MSYDYDDDQQQSGGALRAQLEDALKKLKAAEEENAKLSASVKSVTLDNILRDKQIPPNIQRWMKRDGVEPTPDAVDKWVAENGEDFGYKPGVQTSTAADSAEKPEGQQSPAEEAPAASAVASVLTPEDVATLQRIQGLLTQGTGQTVLSDQVTTAVNTVESQLGPDASFEDAVAALQSQGIDLQNSRG